MNINLQPISNVVGVLLIVVGLLMFCCIPFSIYFHSGDGGALFTAGCITMIFGIISWMYKFKSNAQVNKREGYLIVAIGWLAMIIFGALPYEFSGVTYSFTDSLFESVSGLTTTGATIFIDIESLPEGVLLWRSLSQWIGGMGIIVLTVAIFPLLGIGGIELFTAEVPGPTSDKIHPRIKETAKLLWMIYVGFTFLLFVILLLEGMSAFESLNHAFTVMATGGFSTRNDSIAAFGSHIQYTIVFFMFLSGTNYTVIYHGLTGKWRKVFGSPEFVFYLILIGSLTIIVWIQILYLTREPLEQTFRTSLFQIVSILTSSGFVTANYTGWSNGITFLFFVLFFSGGCAGSTTGGIKLIRHLIFLKNTILEFKRILHPRAIIRIKLSGNIVAPRILTHILVFLLVYLFFFIAGSLTITILGMDFVSAVGAAASALGNVGPAIGSVGPEYNYFYIPTAAKWVLSFLMLIGRLELFTILVLFTPYFWRTN